MFWSGAIKVSLLEAELCPLFSATPMYLGVFLGTIRRTPGNWEFSLGFIRLAYKPGIHRARNRDSYEVYTLIRTPKVPNCVVSSRDPPRLFLTLLPIHGLQ